ncbi:MAG: methyltransferase domain-containing protein [Methanomassiliicoccales archaeon]
MTPHRFNVKDRNKLDESWRWRIQPAQEIIDRAAINGSETCLDLGCGIGYISIPLAARGANVIALDIERIMLDTLLKKTPSMLRDRIIPLLCKLPLLPLKSAVVDHVVAVNVVHEVDAKELLVNEIARVLKSGGRVSVVDFQKKPASFGPPLHERLSFEEMLNLFSRFSLKARFIFDEFYQLEFSKY